MKTQSINLYNKLIDPSLKTRALNLRQVMILDAILVAVMLVIYSYQAINVSILKKKDKQLTTAISILESDFYHKKKQYPEIFFASNAEQQINNKNKQLKAHKLLLDNISNYDELTNYLTTFSRIIAKNVWINAINITEGGDSIKISGQSITNSPMNTFLENIINDKALADYTLNVNEVSKDQSSSAKPVNFEIELHKRS